MELLEKVKSEMKSIPESVTAASRYMDFLCTNATSRTHMVSWNLVVNWQVSQRLYAGENSIGALSGPLIY
jgi:hypothetical protein